MACIPFCTITSEDSCEESFAGLGTTAWVFLHSDLKNDLAFIANGSLEGAYENDNVDGDTVASVVYDASGDIWKTGKEFGFVKVELKPNSQSITGESNKTNSGFKQTCQAIFDSTGPRISRFMRALNNRKGKFGIVFKDGDKYQIMYTPGEALDMDAGSIKTETGAASSDDRQTTLALVLSKAWAPETYVWFGRNDADTADKTPDDKNA